MILLVFAQLGAVLPAGSFARRRTRRSRRTSSEMRWTSLISIGAGRRPPIVRVGVRTWAPVVIPPTLPRRRGRSAQRLWRTTTTRTSPLIQSGSERVVRDLNETRRVHLGGAPGAVWAA
jgi:hypothetical protein